MYYNLLDTIIKLPKTFSRDGIDENALNLLNAIDTDVRPPLETLVNFLKKHNKKLMVKSVPALKTMTTGTNISSNLPVYKMLEGLIGFLDEVTRNRKGLINCLTHLPLFMVNSKLTVKQSAIIALHDNINDLVFFIADVTQTVTEHLSAIVNVKGKRNRFNEGASGFASTFPLLRGNIGSNLNIIDSLSDDILNTDTVSVLISKGSSHNKHMKIGLNRFIGNPIYHFRKALADLDIDKYRALAERKKYINLLVLELEIKLSQTRADSAPEVNLKREKEIEYYRNRIREMEFEMEELKK